MLLDVRTLQWSAQACDFFGVPMAMLPEVRPSVGVFGTATAAFPGVRIGAALGDQQAALFGQTCFTPGEAKCTYGTGSFLLLNTGTELVRSTHGLLTTVAYQLAGHPAQYALEGSIAITGSLVQWFRDQLELIASAPEIETLARTVTDNGGCYIVPAFSGLYAPYWRSEARGVIVGLTSYITKGHLARAVLEATAWQTREVVDAMNADSGLALMTLKVDGGMTADNLLMQFIATCWTCRWCARWPARRCRSGPRTRPAWPWVTGPTWMTCAATGTGRRSGCRRWTRAPATTSTRTGGGQSSAPSTGSSRSDPQHF
jgi:glycerol kinase